MRCHCLTFSVYGNRRKKNLRKLRLLPAVREYLYCISATRSQVGHMTSMDNVRQLAIFYGRPME